MLSSIKSSQKLTYLFIILCIFCFPLSISDPRTTLAALVCGTELPNGSTTAIYPNFHQVTINLKGILSNQLYGYDSITSPPPPIFAVVQCHRDLLSTDCELCYLEARQQISKCVPYSSGRVFLDGCFLRYDNHSLINEIIDPANDRLNCTSSKTNTKREFAEKVNSVVDNVIAGALLNDGFAVGKLKAGVVSVYVLAQCWKIVNESDCGECLKNAGEKVKTCVPSTEGRAMNAGCYLRYSIDKFYGNNPRTGRSRVTIIASSVVAATVLVLFILLGAYCFVRMQKKRESIKIIRLPSIIHRSNLNFNYETLEKATNFFHESNKLGQGGSGVVYKGTLPDGKIIAVKRLFFCTRQWVDEFFNEVNLIGGVRHKNVVRLLGCSIEGPESLLVYEFMPNMNLDQFLFANNVTQIIKWQQRVDIIYGLADGLAHLHGGSGSQVKIIHRDIKSSNILLDENLNPKIADFGLARGVATDRSHISTGIAGTLGYLAPEYLVRGQLTEKADVYAFGVLILEVVCGRKNSVYSKGSASVLRTVWKHYKTGKLPEAVDPSLQGDFPTKGASKVLQIGLLCTQASAALRPSMIDVVQMLRYEKGEIPVPEQPPFLNASVLGEGESSEFSSTGFNLESGQATVEISSSSSTKSLGIAVPSGGR